MTRLQLFREKSRFAEHAHRTVGPENTKGYIWRSFRAFGAFREAILLEQKKDGNYIADIDGRMARDFADMVLANLEKGVESAGCETLALMPSIIRALPGGGLKVGFDITIPGNEDSGPKKSAVDTVVPVNSIAIGLVREDGLTTPLAFSLGLMLLQHGDGHMLGGYDHRTDFQKDFSNWLKPGSFI